MTYYAQCKSILNDALQTMNNRYGTAAKWNGDSIFI